MRPPNSTPNRVAPLALLLAAIWPCSSQAGMKHGQVKRVSDRSSTKQANDDSYRVSISANGRFMAFNTKATNLVKGDTNDANDVFVADRKKGTVERVSVRSNGKQTKTGFNTDCAISHGGRYVAFASSAKELVGGDTNNKMDVFVHDRNSGKTKRVSLHSNGAEGNETSRNPAISKDGRFVAFTSEATSLVDGDSNGTQDVFLRDRKSKTTRRISVATGGDQANGKSYAPRMSADGRFIVYRSEASNLVSGDTNAAADIFLHDCKTETTTRVSVSSMGFQATGGSSVLPDISADGNRVTFNSTATNLVGGDVNGLDDVFLHDREAGTTARISVKTGGAEANGGSTFADISPDGRFVAFMSTATNLVPGTDDNADWDVFLHDSLTSNTTRISQSADGVLGDDFAGHPSVAKMAKFVAFEADATNLAKGADTNAAADIFIMRR